MNNSNAPSLSLFLLISFALDILGADTLAIVPPKLEANQVRISLPAACDDLCVGGAGRFIALHLPTINKIAVFDINEAKVVGFVPAEKKLLIAAGLDFLVTVDPVERKVNRYRLPSLEEMGQGTLEGSGPIEVIALGNASSGPLLVGDHTQYHFFDLLTLKKGSLGAEKLYHRGHSDQVRASANGRLFSMWSTQSSPTGVGILVLENGDFKAYRDHQTAGLLVPDDTGELVHTAIGSYSPQAKRTVPPQRYVEQPKYRRGPQPISVTIPAVHGPYTVRIDGENIHAKTNEANPLTKEVAIFLPGMMDPFIKLNDIEVRQVCIADQYSREPLSIEKRLLFLPAAQLIVTLPESNDALVLRRIDIAKELEQSGADYLFVMSRPTTTFEVGKPWKYDVDVWSKRGNATVTLNSGPKGMQVAGKTVTWTPQARSLGGQENVILSISDASGKSVFHQFELRPTDGDSTLSPSELTKVDDRHRELLIGMPRVFPGEPQKSTLLLGRDCVLVLSSDGFTVEHDTKLSKEYSFIGARDQYYVAASADPPVVDLIDRKTGEIRSSIRLAGAITSLALHPKQPFSYVAYRASDDIPSHMFVVVDEETGKAKSGDEFVGAQLVIDPLGAYLYSAYDDVYEKGARIIANPGRLRVIPTYGNLNLLFRFSLRDPMKPAYRSAKDRVGPSGLGLRVSADGKQVVNLSERYLGKLFGRNPADWDDVPTVFELGFGLDQGLRHELVYHPLLNLSAALGPNNAVHVFENLTGNKRKDIAYVPELEKNSAYRHLYFSADGKSLITIKSIQSRYYLFKTDLAISPTDHQKLKLALESESTVPSSPTRRGAREQINFPPLAQFDALRGGIGKPMSTAEISKSFGDSIVVIRCGQSTGTGFVVGNEGLILTCAHCLEDQAAAIVEYRTRIGGKVSTAKVAGGIIARDDDLDLALLKINATSLTPTRLAIGVEPVDGEDVIVIANPSRGADVLGNTITTGVVSNSKRVIEEQNYIQISAAVNPGSSGGALFNERGLVMGIVSRKARIEGAGFAIPAREIVRFLVRASNRKLENGLPHSWVDASGERQLDAAFLGLSDGKLQLRRADNGEALTLGLDRLSEGDRQFAEEVTKESK